MARIPLEPHLARMLVEAKRLNCVEDMEVIMGFLSSTKSLFPRLGKDEVFTEKYRDFVVEGSDILTQAAVWNEFLAQGEDGKKIAEWARENHINLDGLYDVRSIKNDLSGKDEMEGEGVKVEDKPVDIAGKKDAIMQANIAGLGDRLLFEQEERIVW
jgi:ATP-dependent helicase HrpA